MDDVAGFTEVAQTFAAAENRYRAARERLVIWRRIGGDSVREISVATGLRVAVVEAILASHGRVSGNDYWLYHSSVKALELSPEVLRGIGATKARFFWSAARPDGCACQTIFDAPVMRPVCQCQCE